MSGDEYYQDKVVAAYLGLAIGDALGATTEFMTPNEIRKEYGQHNNIIGGGWLRLKPGQVTDDTTMSLVLGESILRDKTVIPHSVANAFSEWLRSKPVDVGHTVRRGIIHFRHSGIPISPESETDAGNGACMRTLPVALGTLFQKETVVRMLSRNQAHTTHNNALSDAGTECIVLMIQAAMLDAGKSELRMEYVEALIRKFPVFKFTNTRVENPTGFIVETLQAVFQAFFAHTSFEESMLDVVNRGGDSDTTGAILGMLAGSYYGLNAIPEKWLNGLDPSIKQACERQAIELLDLAMNSGSQLLNHSGLAISG